MNGFRKSSSLVRAEQTNQEAGTALVPMMCVHIEHFSWCSPWGYGGTVNGLVEPSSLPVSTPLWWLAADLMGLAAVEEKQ